MTGEKRPFSIWIAPAEDGAERCFEEAALALKEGLVALGHDCAIARGANAPEGAVIVLGALFIAGQGRLPPGAIVFNHEQIGRTATSFGLRYLKDLSQHATWDYSPNNIAALHAVGIRARFCGVGYSPGLSRITPARDRDIDVLFVGSFHPRRHAVLEALHQRGVRVEAYTLCYGAARDGLYARAKIVLNVHQFDTQVLEMVRLQYLLANRICVVSETGLDEALEAPLRGGVAFAAYDGLVERCIALLGDEPGRLALAEKGFQNFAALRQEDFLRQALSSPP